MTFRERLPLAKFTKVTLTMTEEISTDYAENRRSIVHAPIIDTKLWRSAAEWCQNATVYNHILIEDCDTHARFHVPTLNFIKTGQKFDSNAVEKIQSIKWKTFDQYMSLGYGQFWSVNVSKNKESWAVESSCDCRDFLKNFKCIHVIALALRMQIAVLPRNAIPTMLGKKKGAGRKKKSTKALLVQTK